MVLRKGLVTIFLMVLTVCLYSQNYSPEEENARSFYQLNYPYNSQNLADLSIDTSLIYRNLTIVNFSSPKGFVMVRSSSGDAEIMGYSFTDQFSFDVDTTGAVELWADAFSTDTGVPGYDPDKVIPKLKTGRIEIEPLCKTAWNQGWPYNYYCPIDPEADQRTIVGCVAVAVGQIIRYYDKWNNFQIQYSYNHEVYGTLSCGAGQYNWLAMEDRSIGVNNEVARLLYHSGVLVDMGYGVSSSGAQSAKAASLFARIYDGGYLNDDPYGAQESFYNSLIQYKPIYSTYPGHAFVCDGFDGNSFYHFNLGWGGAANGFYALSNVVNNSLVSAIFNTSPEDILKLPGNLKKRILSDSEMEVSWNGPSGDRSDLQGYNIYLDDVYYGETTDTIIVHACHPGSHHLRITARYSDGESRWIGPASYFSHGDPVSISDEKLRIAINTVSGVPSSQRISHSPTEGELNDIRVLNVTNLESLDGIAQCKNLSQLTLFSSKTSTELDLSELSGCSGLQLLKITSYQLNSPESIGSLTKLQELTLDNNSLSNLDFLSSLKDLYKLDIKENNLSDINFLNDLDRLTWISLQECGIQSFDVLENTYGVEYLDISDNSIDNIDFISGNRTIRTLIASGNLISGELSLDGMTKLVNIELSNNQIEKLNITNSPKVDVLNAADNQIHSFGNILEENKLITRLDLSGNLIDTIPSIENRLIYLYLGRNLLYDLVPLDNYRNVLDLELRGNRITDVSPLLFKNYSAKLERLDLRDNPLSKESILEYKSLISDAAGQVYFPGQYHQVSPCYLQPGKDSVLMSRTIQLRWEGDYEDAGYEFDIFLRFEEEEFIQIASGITERIFEAELEKSGNYSWYLLAHLDDDSLFSGYGNFKVFSGFSIPFFEDFEIYSPNEQLCSQSPFWRIYGEDPVPSKDAFVISSRAFESDQSIKVSSSTDLVFPISEYLNGYCETNFKIMVDNNRQGSVLTSLSDGSIIYFYFYSAGICEVYHDQTRIKFFTYNIRTWMDMEIRSDANTGLKWLLNNSLIHSIDTPLAIESIRFNSMDGPGYYESAPTVVYLDNFAINKGTLLSVPTNSLDELFPGKIYSNGDELLIENPAAGLQRVELYSISGQLIKSTTIDDPYLIIHKISIPADSKLIIAVLFDTRNRRSPGKVIYHSY